jgi:tetratricopeptide (TPR) repeat protein
LKTKEGTLFNKLFNNESLSVNDINDLIDLIKPYMIDLIIHLLNDYNQINKYDLITQLNKKYPLNSKIISYLSSALIKKGKLEDAIHLLEKSINDEIMESSIIMYLASIYIQTNKLEKLISLLEKVETKSLEDPILLKHLNLLKEKLAPLFETQIAQ